MGIIDYIKNTQGEMKHVVWPSRTQVIAYTAIVIGISVLVAYYLGLLDLAFTKLLGLLVAKV